MISNLFLNPFYIPIFIITVKFRSNLISIPDSSCLMIIKNLFTKLFPNLTTNILQQTYFKWNSTISIKIPKKLKYPNLHLKQFQKFLIQRWDQIAFPRLKRGRPLPRLRGPVSLGTNHPPILIVSNDNDRYLVHLVSICHSIRENVRVFRIKSLGAVLPPALLILRLGSFGAFLPGMLDFFRDWTGQTVYTRHGPGFSVVRSIGVVGRNSSHWLAGLVGLPAWAFYRNFIAGGLQICVFWRRGRDSRWNVETLTLLGPWGGTASL